MEKINFNREKSNEQYLSLHISFGFLVRVGDSWDVRFCQKFWVYV